MNRTVIALSIGLTLIILRHHPGSAYCQSRALENKVNITTPHIPEFSFEELKSLSGDLPPGAEVLDKLYTVLHSVEIDNSYSSQMPTRGPLHVDRLGPALRVAEWNIERGENFDLLLLALKDHNAFLRIIRDQRKDLDAKQLSLIEAQVSQLQGADVLLLNEVDLGVTRSGYHHVARELASALKMNFAFGVEFVEVDPLKLGTETLTLPDVANDPQLQRDLESRLTPDPKRYRGLHGSAILSRYPISSAYIQRLPICHDWFHGERDHISALEKGKRYGADKVFLEKIEREIRRGGRMAIVAALAVNEGSIGSVTAVVTHLEDKCKPDCRRRQMEAILERIQPITGPVIMAGDMNTTGADGSLLSAAYLVKSKATDYRFWGREALMMATPIPSLRGLRYYRRYNDPTVRDIPFLAENREAQLFRVLQSFEFADGGRFDFRGKRSRTVNNTRKRLADSNQRSKKGFVYTFSLPRDFGGMVGRSRLDWFFIKPMYARGKRTDVLSPYFPRTLVELNDAPAARVSDHSPITVDLPLSDPRKANTHP